jgi:hypothetical protein
VAQRILSLSGQRSFSAVTTTTISATIPAVTVGASVIGGIYLQPQRLTPQVDVRRSIGVWILLSPAANSLVDGQHVSIQLSVTQVNADGTLTDTNVTYIWPVPNGWLTTDTEFVLIDNGNGVSFDAEFFADQQNIGLRVARLGDKPADTFAQGLKIAEYAVLQYTTREFSVIV